MEQPFYLQKDPWIWIDESFLYLEYKFMVIYSIIVYTDEIPLIMGFVLHFSSDKI